MLSSFRIFLSLVSIVIIYPSCASLEEEVEVLKPTVGPILGRTRGEDVRIWLRGPVLNQVDPDRQFYGLVKLRRYGDAWPDKPAYFPLKVYFDENGFKDPKDFVGYIDIKADLGVYQYQAGYVETAKDQLPDQLTYNWHDEVFSFSLRDPKQSTPSVVFGSCRYFAKIWCWYPWLHTSDQIFSSIANESFHTDAVAFLGDQIYGDYYNILGQSTSYKDFMSLYQKAFTTQNIRQVLATIPTMFTLDDHEVSNNFGADYPVTHPDIYRAGMSAYMTYQHMVTPGFTKELGLNHTGYPFMIGDVPAFMNNARSNRSVNPPQIMPTEEMEDIKMWLLHWDQPATHSNFKVIFTSVPMFPIYANNPGQDDDKWMGYPQQMMELLDFISDHLIFGVVICSGDIHKSLYTQITSPTGVTISTVIASPFFSPWGHDEGPNSELQNEVGIKDFVKGYPYVSGASSRIYHTDAYARLQFRQGAKLHIQLVGRDGEWLNQNDPAGDVYDLSLPDAYK